MHDDASFEPDFPSSPRSCHEHEGPEVEASPGWVRPKSVSFKATAAIIHFPSEESGEDERTQPSSPKSVEICRSRSSKDDDLKFIAPTVRAKDTRANIVRKFVSEDQPHLEIHASLHKCRKEKAGLLDKFKSLGRLFHGKTWKQRGEDMDSYTYVHRGSRMILMNTNIVDMF
jgi:hypothetical protein